MYVSELIPPRDDEQLDIKAVAAWIRSQESLPAGIPDVAQFGGGKANLTYLLTFPNGIELVLRRPPLGPIAQSSHDMTREYRVLSRLWSSFNKAPRAFALCEDESVIGAKFTIMERKPGVVVRGSVPEVFGAGEDVESNRKLSEVVIDTLAEFHRVDPSECGLGELGHPDGFLSRQVAGWSERWENARHEDNPLADDLGRWLLAEMPTSSKTTLLHNDWRLDNMAVSPTDPGECTAVYDWDMATRGDPLVDLGTLLASWFDPGEAPEALGMMPTQTVGWMERATAVKRYRGQVDHELDSIDWYLAFGSWKLAIILQQIYIRWLRGQTKDPRFAALDDGARLLFRLADERRN